MKIVVLGAKGMLGSDLVAACRGEVPPVSGRRRACRGEGVEVAGFDLPELDISSGQAALDILPSCDWVLNCAAYTDVDGAESARDAAFAVNCEGAKHVAAWCESRDIPLLYVSTDYVFDGSEQKPYREDDSVKPSNTYAESKLAGEQAIQSICSRYILLRTQSLFGVNGSNFVKAIMAKLEKDDDPVDVVNDQTSCPTYTVHLADAILRLLNAKKQGIVHVSASGSCTWYEFARAIAEKVKPGAVVRPITSGVCKRPARRPLYSVLDKTRYTVWTGHEMPSWKEGLGEYISELSNGVTGKH